MWYTECQMVILYARSKRNHEFSFDRVLCHIIYMHNSILSGPVKKQMAGIIGRKSGILLFHIL